MTAEVAILNRHSVAIAADSAVTINDARGQKIFSSVDKVFPLSSKLPVGIMIYGNAEFMGVPWETIIHEFRSKVGDQAKSTLKAYAESFISYIKSDERLFPKPEQKRHVHETVARFLRDVHQMISYKVNHELLHSVKNIITDQGDENPDELTDNMLSAIEFTIKKHYELWMECEDKVPKYEQLRAAIEAVYQDDILALITDIFSDLGTLIHNDTKIQLYHICVNLFLKFPKHYNNVGESGIVICGFGEEELYPSLYAYTLYGVVDNMLKYKLDMEHKMDNHENRSLIVPFAQTETVYTFINGISNQQKHDYQDLLIDSVAANINEVVEETMQDKTSEERLAMKNSLIAKSLERLKNGIIDLGEQHYQKYANSVHQVVTMLPKSEMAEMAESLVNLSCLKKKITMEDETVGGPIDVAILSRQDGFTWVKKKQAFSS